MINPHCCRTTERGYRAVSKRLPKGRRSGLSIGMALGAIALTALFSTGCSRILWRPDLGGALRMAGRNNRFVLVQVWSPLNLDCMRMEEEVFNQRDVRETLTGVIPVRLDALWNRQFMRNHGIGSIPSFLMFAPDGSLLRMSIGYMDEAQFRGFVEAARLSY